jgi:phage terminase large subunit-like protein
MVVVVADPVTAYAEHVLAGEFVTGKLVRLACERHLRDLEDGETRGLYFDPEGAQHAIDFFGFLRHSKGEWAGKVVELEQWQQFIVGALFGWKRSNGTRRFRTAYNEIARKNGKSTLAAGIALYLLVGDGEPGAEVYCAATKRDQAKIVFDEAANMVKRSPSLGKRIREFARNLNVPSTMSKMEPLGADADTMDGLNPHGVIIDELHAHRNSGVVDVLDTATGSRRQPLQFEITTAGYDRASICYSHRTYATQILEGIIQDDAWFVYVATIDPDDNWLDPSVWAKANPNLGVSVKLDDLAKKCETASQMPAAQNAFKRLRLNVWTEQADRWLDLDVWEANGAPVDEDELAGEVCFGALDMSMTTDITALCYVFPPTEEREHWAIVSRFFIPGDAIKKRSDRDRVPYDQWARDGFIIRTEGNVVDYDVVHAQVVTDATKFRVREVAYDRFNATQLVTNLMGEGLDMVPFGQGFVSMSAPTKELEKLLLSKRIAHNAHPVLRWMAANVAVRQDPAGNLKPDKQKSTERIDGIVATIMALGRAMITAHEGDSIYESRGILTF